MKKPLERKEIIIERPKVSLDNILDDNRALDEKETVSLDNETKADTTYYYEYNSLNEEEKENDIDNESIEIEENIEESIDNEDDNNIEEHDISYSEPAEYIPEEIRKEFGVGEYNEEESESQEDETSQFDEESEEDIEEELIEESNEDETQNEDEDKEEELDFKIDFDAIDNHFENN